MFFANKSASRKNHRSGSSWRRPRLAFEQLESRLAPAVSLMQVGVGIAADSAPTGIVVDAFSHVWFTEQAANKVGELAPNGTVNEFGQGITAGSAPTGITLGPDGNLWFTEQGGHGAIARMTRGGTVTEFQTRTSGSHPVGITTGPDGNLWFTELYTGKIGRITPQGVITEFTPAIPNGVQSQPDLIRTGPDGNLWFTDATGRIGRITTGGTVTEFGGNLSDPLGLTVGPDGNLWFTEKRGDEVGRITPQGAITEFGTGDIGGQPTGIIAGPDGNLWFTEFHTGKVGRVTTAGSVTLYDVGLTSSSGPNYLAAGPDGTLWLTEQGTSRIGRLFITSPTEFSAGITANSAPTGIVVDAQGNVWFTEQLADKVARLAPNGTVTEFSKGITKGSAPTGITLGPDGNLWFTEEGGSGAKELQDGDGTPTISGGHGAIARMTPGGTVTEFQTPTSGSHPVSITTGPDGNLWFTELNTGKIGRITTSGTITEFLSGAVGSPDQIRTGPDGNLWYTDASGRIGRITTGGTMTQFASGIQWNSNGADPLGLTVGPDGNLWFTDKFTDHIGRITPQGVITEFATNLQGGEPTGLVAGPDGNLWFTEFRTGLIGRITTGGTVSLFDLGLASGSHPKHLAAGPDGSLWFTEQGSSRIGRVAIPTTLTIQTEGVDLDDLGISVNLTAGGTTPSDGLVIFMDNGVGINRTTVINGLVGFSLWNAKPGPHILTATYLGSLPYEGASTGIEINVPVLPTSLTLDAPTIVVGADGSVTVTVNGEAHTPVGSVTLTVDGTTKLTSTLDTSDLISTRHSNSVTFTVPGLSAGDHTLRADFAPQQNFLGSSATGTLHVTGLGTRTVLGAPSVLADGTGQVTVSVSSTGGTPTGTVSLVIDGGKPLTASLTNGVATFTTADLTTALHTLTAQYSAQGKFKSSSATAVYAPLSGSGATLTPLTGRKFSGTVATFSDPDLATRARSFTTTIDWGDGMVTTGTVLQTSPGNFQVTGQHIYTTAGVYNMSVTIGDPGDSALALTSVAYVGGPATHFGIVTSPSAVAGQPLVVKFFALDAQGHYAYSYSGTIHFTSGDGRATLPDYTFKPSELGGHGFNSGLVFRTAGTWTLTATDAKANLTGTSAAFTIKAATAAQLLISGPVSVTAGTAFTITVTVMDAYGNAVQDYKGTIAFRSNDNQADLPNSYTFSANDHGVHQFSIVLRTPRKHATLTVEWDGISHPTGKEFDLQVNAANSVVA